MPTGFVDGSDVLCFRTGRGARMLSRSVYPERDVHLCVVSSLCLCLCLVCVDRGAYMRVTAVSWRHVDRATADGG